MKQREPLWETHGSGAMDPGEVYELWSRHYLHISAWVCTRPLHFQTFSELHNLQIVKRKHYGPSLDPPAFLVLFIPSPCCTPSNSPNGRFVSIFSVCSHPSEPLHPNFCACHEHIQVPLFLWFILPKFSDHLLRALFLEIIVIIHLNHFSLYYLILTLLVQNKHFCYSYFITMCIHYRKIRKGL